MSLEIVDSAKQFPRTTMAMEATRTDYGETFLILVSQRATLEMPCVLSFNVQNLT